MLDTLLYFADLEADLDGLRKWLHEVESRVLPLQVKPSWTVLDLEDKLREHQVSCFVLGCHCVRRFTRPRTQPRTGGMARNEHAGVKGSQS